MVGHVGSENDKLRDFTNPKPLRAVCSKPTERHVKAVESKKRPCTRNKFGTRTSCSDSPARILLPSAVAVASVVLACIVSSGDFSPNSVNRADRVFT